MDRIHLLQYQGNVGLMRNHIMAGVKHDFVGVFISSFDLPEDKVVSYRTLRMFPPPLKQRQLFKF